MIEDTIAVGPRSDRIRRFRDLVAGRLGVRAISRDGDQKLAQYADATPAAVHRRVGAGRVTAFGFLPATEYLRRATRDYYDHHETTIIPGYIG